MSLAAFLSGQPPLRVNGASRLRERRALVDEALRSLGRPARPQRDAARSAVAGLSNGAAAWETLAARGLIPLDWVESPNRAFYLEGGQANWVRETDDTTYPGHLHVVLTDWSSSRAHTPQEFRDGYALGDLVLYRAWGAGVHPSEAGFYRIVKTSPPSVDLACALASDPAGVATAEALAREFIARLVPWGADPDTRLIWRLAETGRLFGDKTSFPGTIAQHGALLHQTQLYEASAAELETGPGAAALQRALARETRWLAERLTSHAPTPLYYFSQLLASALHAPHWGVAGMSVRQGRLFNFRVPAPLLGRPFREIPDPFEPLLALMALGYAVNDTLGPNLVLLAPPLPEQG